MRENLRIFNPIIGRFAITSIPWVIWEDGTTLNSPKKKKINSRGKQKKNRHTRCRTTQDLVPHFRTCCIVTISKKKKKKEVFYKTKKKKKKSNSNNNNNKLFTQCQERFSISAQFHHWVSAQQVHCQDPKDEIQCIASAYSLAFL